jgi:hypothetical protein
MLVAAATVALIAFPGVGNASEQLSPTEETTDIITVENADGSTDFSTENLRVRVLPAPVSASDTIVTTNSAAAVIECTLSVDDAHGSTHVTGTTNVMSKVQCKNGVAGSIKLATQLIRMTPSHTEWGATTKTVVGKAYAGNNAATSCSAGPGNFRGWASPRDRSLVCCVGNSFLVL